MTEEFIIALKDANVDTDTAITRFSGNTQMYEHFLRKFTDDSSFQKSRVSFELRDYEAAASAIHTLKGVSGNLGITQLYQACDKTLSLLRANENEAALLSFDEVERSYHDIIHIINDERWIPKP